MSWPNKSLREELEINGFIKSYKVTYPDIDFEIVDRREKPDYIVRSKISGEDFGVELTSVYMNGRSVPDEHIPPIKEDLKTIGIPYDPQEVEEYKKRLIDAITIKIMKARKGYDLSHPIMLSVHVNEHRAIFMDTRKEWDGLVIANEQLFDEMHPFIEIVFWNLANGGIFCVKPGESSENYSPVS